jgi:hypothetical protein
VHLWTNVRKSVFKGTLIIMEHTTQGVEHNFGMRDDHPLHEMGQSSTVPQCN